MYSNHGKKTQQLELRLCGGPHLSLKYLVQFQKPLLSRALCVCDQHGGLAQQPSACLGSFPLRCRGGHLKLLQAFQDQPLCVFYNSKCGILHDKNNGAALPGSL